MKVIISYPPLQGKGFPMLRQARQFQWVSIPSHIYPIISASALTLLKKDGFDAVFNDCLLEKWPEQKFFDFIDLQQPDVIAFETKTPVIKSHWRIIDRIKERNQKVKAVLMGDHVSVFPEESLNNCKVDYVITGGDYDLGLLGLAKHLREGSPFPKGIWCRQEAGLFNSGSAETNADLNKLPFINRELTPWKLYGEKWKRRYPFAYTMAGRDCPYGRCSFCSWANIYPNFRVREPDNFLEEIDILVNKYGAREIFDDTGTFPQGAWLEKFCNGMVKKKFNKKIIFSCNSRFDYLTEDNARLMKMAGFRKLKLGLESASQETLDRINKGITIEQVKNGCRLAAKVGLNVHLTVMFGYPWEKKSDVLRTINFVRGLLNKGHIEMLQSTLLVPYPGTALFNDGLANGWFRFDHREYERYGMQEAVFKTMDISSEELKVLCRKTYGLFFSPPYILKKIINKDFIGNLNYFIKGAVAMAGHSIDFSGGRGKNI
ncbi:MAG: radical SAM protein [Candidatus Omnitrophota bacterium]|jgi:radical SAM superfamily enzyme YgiQ (UPF0313 family)|nr:MAG: radical SAM protein [Candidatus Omnitrophota bacterium]